MYLKICNLGKKCTGKCTGKSYQEIFRGCSKNDIIDYKYHITSPYCDILLRSGSGKKGGQNEETLVEKDLDGRLRSISAHDIAGNGGACGRAAWRRGGCFG